MLPIIMEIKKAAGSAAFLPTWAQLI